MYYALVESKLHTRATTRRHDIGMIHIPWGAAVMVHYTHGRIDAGGGRFGVGKAFKILYFTDPCWVNESTILTPDVFELLTVGSCVYSRVHYVSVTVTSRMA